MKKRLAIIGVICFVSFVVFGTIWVNSRGDKMVQLTEHGRQVAFLEEHENEMTEFIKAQNPKIESVQFDWDSVDSEVVGNGTPQGGGNILSISARVNYSNYGVILDIDTDIKKLDKINSMWIGSSSLPLLFGEDNNA